MKTFGNDRLLLERYIEEPRHVEFQVFGDGHGNVVHLFERDCSLQRRHQKVVEESPAPRYADDLRQRMAKAAVAAARGVDYENAGTVEFIVTPENDFYFMEMNTRLQVEHPVTEQVVGVDLVRAQLLVAAGQPLPWRADQLRQRGHAIECRVYAEHPAEGFLPQAGPLLLYREPAGPGVRVDRGVREGGNISVHYDPLVAKLIVSAESRALALARMDRALSEFAVLGIHTNVPFLRALVNHPEVRAGRLDTRFIERTLDELVADTRVEALPEEVAAAALLAAATSTSPGTSTVEKPDPWRSLTG